MASSTSSDHLSATCFALANRMLRVIQGRLARTEIQVAELARPIQD